MVSSNTLASAYQLHVQPTDVITPMMNISHPLTSQSVQFFAGNGEKVLTVKDDGTIEFNPDLNMDEATKGFIQALEMITGKPSYPRRVQDLLETNNLYLVRARTAEGLLNEALDKIEPLTQADEEFITKTRQYLKER